MDTEVLAETAVQCVRTSHNSPAVLAFTLLLFSYTFYFSHTQPSFILLPSFSDHYTVLWLMSLQTVGRIMRDSSASGDDERKEDPDREGSGENND